MAFTVETGVGVTGANAYMSETEVTTHHTDRGLSLAAYSTAQIKSAIIKASDYVDKRFGRRFRGDKLSSTQGLEWPRSGAYSDEGYLLTSVPEQLKKAIAEYTALVLALGRDLAPVPAPDFGYVNTTTGAVTNLSSGKIIEKSEEVGPIKTATKFADGSKTGHPMVGTGNLSQNIPEYPQADLWIEELIRSYTSRELSRG